MIPTTREMTRKKNVETVIAEKNVHFVKRNRYTGDENTAIQYAKKMGFRTVALSRGTAKKDFAMKLGATDYIDIQSQNVGEALQAMGGAACIVVTAPNPEVITPLLAGLGNRGKLLLFTAIGPVPVDTVQMVLKGLSVHGWPSGHAIDSEEAIEFARVHDIKCMIEKFPLDKANEALDHM